MIYLDNNATTRLAPEVVTAMQPFLTEFYGNPSSSHTFGRKSREAIEKARETIANTLGAARTDEIIFTSSGTESTNWAIRSALPLRAEKKRVVTTAVEHEATARMCDSLEGCGYEIVRLGVESSGLLDLEALRCAVTSETALVSVMAANNETGVMFPVAKIAEIVKERSGALFHVDGVQAVGKIPINLKETAIDFFAISGHKFHAPKGVGALYISNKVELPPFLLGGGQERKRRAGTENVASIVGLGTACELIQNLDFNVKTERLRDRLENEILEKIPNSRLNGTQNSYLRLPNTTNVSFAGIEGESILAHFDAKGICVSTGSACNSGTHISSPVLRAMNVPYYEAMGAIRFSLSRYTTEAEIEDTLSVLPEVIEKLRKMSPLS